MKLKHTSLAASLFTLMMTGLAGTAFSPSAWAYDEASTAAINVEQDQVIVKGYDVVAYFAHKAIKGDKAFSADYMGATYLFSSKRNMQTFQANPAHYAPQFGGFCAMGVSLGKKLDVDPTQFVVFKNKLYLNVNADVFKIFTKDLAGNVKKAEANWPQLQDKAPNTL
jgi:YHS domain-containing protein